MKVVFLALWPSGSARYWSGTPHYSLAALREIGLDVTPLEFPVLDPLLFHAGRITRRLRLDLLREPLVRRLYNALARRRLRRLRPDVVVSVGASHKLCDVEGEFALIHAADALFATIIESYGNMARLSERSKRLGDRIQRDFLARVDTLCLSSDWAVDSARRHYDLSHCNVRMLPLGANLPVDPGYDAPARAANTVLSLLFVGGDWVRKGGPLLLQAFARIRAEVPDAVLHVVGCDPAEAAGVEGVQLHGFLDKAEPAQRARLDQLYRESAVLVVPSRQEAFGIVFCEACAYGLPPVGTRTGGIPSILSDGESGVLIDPDAGAEVWAARILALWRDRDAYLAMCATARRHYEERLNWSAWARAIRDEAARLTR
ncbi:glycosyltransferase family 4 protein [Pseudooceanicola nanhaiensis]|uniref:glycosyltransferase family 4 protein n=1 Tax=Pseudooceanicola nanhaiensis TaxID=375761 RepID=UPI0040595D5A